MQDQMIIIDGLQYSRWDRSVFEQMRRGGLSCVHVTIAYWENARETLSNIGRWNLLFERHADLIMPVRVAADVERARDEGKVGIVFGFQNCSPIEDDIGLVEVFHQLNVRFMQLTYNNQSLLGSGCYEAQDTGISRFGKVVIQEMNRVGMLIDMSHSGERSTLEAIDLSARPITISHANPSSFHDALRNKSDEVLTAMSKRGGLLGFSLYPFHLAGGPECTPEAFCSMVSRAVDLMGIDHVGIGSDLCLNQELSVLEWMRNGRWSRELDYGEGSAANAKWPDSLPWFADSSDFPNLTDGLRHHGFSEPDVRKIMGENWLRFFAESFVAA